VASRIQELEQLRSLQLGQEFSLGFASVLLAVHAPAHFETALAEGQEASA